MFDCVVFEMVFDGCIKSVCIVYVQKKYTKYMYVRKRFKMRFSCWILFNFGTYIWCFIESTQRATL